MFSRNLEALRGYSPQPYSGPVALLLAREPAGLEREAHLTTWARLAGGGLEVHILPGDHYSLLRGEGVAALAARLGALLARADRPGHRSGGGER